MTERILFNPGDQIANSHDFTQLSRATQIFRTDNPLEAVVVTVNDNDKSFAIDFKKAPETRN